MKTSIWRPLLRGLHVFIFGIAVLWAMPGSTRAQLYVTSRPGGGNAVVRLYNATTGATINANFIAGLTNEIDLGLAVSGNTLFVVDINTSTVGTYDATTGAAINVLFITGLTEPTGIAVK